jgi:hypothetical protein
LGKPEDLDITFLEEACKALSKKELKISKIKEVKFDFKKKG